MGAVGMAAPADASLVDAITAVVSGMPNVHARIDAKLPGGVITVFVSREHQHAWVASSPQDDPNYVSVGAAPLDQNFGLVRDLCRALESGGFRHTSDLLARAESLLGC